VVILCIFLTSPRIAATPIELVVGLKESVMAQDVGHNKRKENNIYKLRIPTFNLIAASLLITVSDRC